jgi:hypothetical protein
LQQNLVLILRSRAQRGVSKDGRKQGRESRGRRRGEMKERLIMPGSALFVVRSVVADESMREKFDHWYSANHMPWAVRALGVEKAWRLWSATDSSVHYAMYRFADMDRLNAAVQSDEFKELVADFDRSWPSGVRRSRELLTLVEEMPEASG